MLDFHQPKLNDFLCELSGNTELNLCNISFKRQKNQFRFLLALTGRLSGHTAVQQRRPRRNTLKEFSSVECKQTPFFCLH